VRFLADFNIGRAVADYLLQAGHDTVFVGDADPRMSDVDILLWAVRERRIVVTMDADFGELVHGGGNPSSVLRLSGIARSRLQTRKSAPKEVFGGGIGNQRLHTIPPEQETV